METKCIAIVYATREGHTRKIAEYMADHLSKRGVLVDVRNALDPSSAIDLSMHCGAILAASVHLGSHEKEMVRFVKDYCTDLERIPTLFLSVTLAEAGVELPGRTPESKARAEAGVRQVIDKFLADTGWRPTHIQPVAGALPYTKYNWLVRFVMKRIAQAEGIDTDTSKEFEYTNWKALDTYADELAEEAVASKHEPQYG